MITLLTIFAIAVLISQICVIREALKSTTGLRWKDKESVKDARVILALQALILFIIFCLVFLP